MGGDGECNIDLSEELEFHGIEYLISVSVSDGPVLVIDVEQVIFTIFFAFLLILTFCLKSQKDDGQRWHGEFSANYIEEVTHKTGNFKKFSVFAKMLASSLRQVVPRAPHAGGTVECEPAIAGKRKCLRRPLNLRGPRNAAE
jgi:hypothetical protein